MRQQTFSTAEGHNLSTPIQGFSALTVIVDNYSASWLLIPNGRRVPPWQYGVTIPLRVAVASADAQWVGVTPAGVSPATAGQGVAEFMYTDAALPPSNGVPVVVPTSQTVPLSVASVLTPPVGVAPAAVGSARLPLAPLGGASGTYIMNLPAATESIMVGISLLGGFTVVEEVSLLGAQSGILYGNAVVTSGEPPAFIEVVTGADTQLEVTIAWQNGAINPGDYVELIAMPFPGAVAVSQNAGAIFDVNVTEEAGEVLHIGGVPGSPQQPLMVSPGADSGILIQVIAANVNAGASTTVIPLQLVGDGYLGRLHIDARGAAGADPLVRLNNASGDIAQFSWAPNAAGSVLVCETDFDYAQVHGTPLTIINGDSVTHLFRGFATYRVF